MRKLALLLLTALPLVACDEDGEVFERIEKLRALGAGATPVVAVASAPGETRVVKLSFYVAAAPDAVVTWEPFLDEDAPAAAQPIPLNIEWGSEERIERAKLTIHRIDANFATPPASEVRLPPGQTFARLRYGLTARVDGDVETLVGTLPLYPAAESAPAYQPLTVKIDTPSRGAAVGSKGALHASIENQNDENVRVGWFVSSGKVKNRRARETEWQEVAGGPQTVVATVRGLKSGAFSLEALDVTGP